MAAAGCGAHFDEDDDRRPQANPAVAPAVQLSFENGEAVLTLDQQTQARMGIGVATLTATLTRAEEAVPAVVLSAQELATFRNSYLMIQAQIEKDRVDMDVAEKEYDRLKTLFDENRNVSEKALQAAEGTVRSLEADEHTAEQQLGLQRSVAAQQWGSVVAGWAVNGSPELDRVLAAEEALMQVTLPFDQKYAVPATIAVEVPGRAPARATLISSFPRVDPRIQGRDFLYSSPAQPDFTPGVNLLAHLAVGSAMRGVIMPTSAVVWSEGKAWTYVQTAANRVSRREVSTEVPVDDGYFLSAGFSAGNKVVSRGAQSLLSEESVLQGYGGGGGDED
jgi:hypothetical protein